MTLFTPKHNGSLDLLSAIRFSDFEVSWAGPLPRKEGFCFGSDDGKLLYSDFNGKLFHSEPDRIGSSEAVNGVAFIDTWMAVSTRNEIVVVRNPSKVGEQFRFTQIPHGAHDVIASSDGLFIAPLGPEGLLFIHAKDGPSLSGTVRNGPVGELYFYRVISLQEEHGRTMVACAARQAGVATMELNGIDEPNQFRVLTFDGLDVVDICPLDASEMSAPVAAVGSDGTLILFQNLLTDRKPLTVKYQSIIGKAYRLLSARGNLFLLTSKGLFVITELLTRFSEGQLGNYVTPILPLPMEAVDANLVADRWILIVMPDEVLRFDLSLLDQYKSTDSKVKHFTKFQGTSLIPTWRERLVMQTSHEEEQSNVTIQIGA